MWNHAVVTGVVALVLLTPAGAGFAYEVVEVRHGGAVAGHVSFAGVPPSPRQFTVHKGTEVCGTERALKKVDVRDGMVRGAVIALEGVERGKPFAAHRDREHAGRGRGAFHYAGGDELNLNVHLDTCSFGPFTGVVTADDAVQFANHDAIRHTLHTYTLQQNTAMLKTVHTRILGADSRTEQVFPGTRLRHAQAVVLTCDRHDFMENWLYLARNPYYAVSDAAGHFRIDGIPPGDYRLVAWHPVLGMRETPVTVAPHGSLAVDFAFAD